MTNEKISHYIIGYVNDSKRAVGTDRCAQPCYYRVLHGFYPDAWGRNGRGLSHSVLESGRASGIYGQSRDRDIGPDHAGAATDDAIRSLLTITSADHILYGSDYPYVAAPALVSAKESLQQRLPALGLTPQAILSDNARRLFGDDIPVREYGERIVRLAEIEVFQEKLEDYMGFASEVGLVSMASEPGVIALFSMQDKADPCKIYILEVYADREAYQAHLQTAHFRKYKEGTADMVKSLKLIDTNPLVTAEFLKKAQ